MSNPHVYDPATEREETITLSESEKSDLETILKKEYEDQQRHSPYFSPIIQGWFGEDADNPNVLPNTPRQEIRPSVNNPDTELVSLFDANSYNEHGENHCVAAEIFLHQVPLYWNHYVRNLEQGA